MNKPVVVLALTAVALAGVAVFLLQRIGAEHDGIDTAALLAEEQRPPHPVETPGAPTTPETPATSPPPATSAAAPADTSAADLRAPVPADANGRTEQQKQRAAELLRHYAIPEDRKNMRASALDSARRNAAGLAEKLGLTPEKYDRLVELLADQSLERSVASARCFVDPACTSPSMYGDAFTAIDQDIRDLIGDDGLRELKTFGRATLERRTVNGLQARLPEGQALTPAQADELTAVLYEEANRQRQDMYQRQEHQSAYSLPDGPSLMFTDRAPTMELMLQSGEAYVQLMRDRAATRLTGDQLIAFNRMYDDLLVAFRRHLRENFRPNDVANDRTP